MYDNSLALMRSMREAGIDCRSDTPEEDENAIDVVRVGWRGRSLPRTVVIFRINDRGAHLEADLGEVAPGRDAAAVGEANLLNGSYRWMKFMVDDDRHLVCASDVFMVPEVAGLFGIAGMGMMFDVLDEVYPRLARLLAAGAGL